MILVCDLLEEIIKPLKEIRLYNNCLLIKRLNSDILSEVRRKNWKILQFYALKLHKNKSPKWTTLHRLLLRLLC